jgi:hypothetical protein
MKTRTIQKKHKETPNKTINLTGKPAGDGRRYTEKEKIK